ncbi:hypothetical protein [Clostridium estertheticum]|nr:hypothetical protein [Clostridium estertheticum]
MYYYERGNTTHVLSSTAYLIKETGYAGSIIALNIQKYHQSEL